MSQPPTYLPRHLDAELLTALSTSPVVILDGPRGVGKTTSAVRLATTTLFLPRDLALLEVDPDTYLAALPPPVLLDEWQLAGTDLLWTVKRIVDADPSPGRFLLTGSVEPASYGPTYPLTGRSSRLVMRPMTWAELEGYGESATFLSRVLAGDLPQPGATSGSAFDLAALARAGFPGARAMPDQRYFLDSYANVVAQRAGDAGRDATRVQRAMRVLSVLTAQAVPDQRIWEAADITKVTWKHYDDLLGRVHLAAPVPAYESNRLKRLTSYPKRFLADTALALSLADLRLDDLRTDPALAGRYLESFVMQQLRPQVDEVRGALMHLRTGAGEREVDAVIETSRDLIGIEVKLGARPTAADARPLLWLRDQLKGRLTQGYVVHTGRECYPLGDRITAVPLALVTGAT